MPVVRGGHQANRPDLELLRGVCVQRGGHLLPVRGPEIRFVPCANAGEVCKDDTRHGVGQVHSSEVVQASGLYCCCGRDRRVHGVHPHWRRQVQSEQQHGAEHGGVVRCDADAWVPRLRRLYLDLPRPDVQGILDDNLQSNTVYHHVLLCIERLWVGQLGAVLAGHRFCHSPPRGPPLHRGPVGRCHHRAAFHFIHNSLLRSADICHRHDHSAVPLHLAVLRAVLAPPLRRSMVSRQGAHSHVFWAVFLRCGVW
mmetsp:Transcript_9297/g.22402  ORF Transcript_9297/g.22402 Transcript_9297/m.22402 type:complete len:254 (-) Transcript_9297:329-1090(-)